MNDKRCFSTAEAYNYLGLKRRSFDMNIAPLLIGKGVKVGVTKVFERADLDAAWERYKLSAGESRSGQKGDPEWGEKERRGYTRQKTVADGKSIPFTKGTAFANAVSQLQPKRKAS